MSSTTTAKRTVTKYLENSTTYEGEVEFLFADEDTNGTYWVFNETWFYPQGGGQPTDKGTIEWDEYKAPIHFVSKVGDEIRHYCQSPNSPSPNTQVQQKIDADLRNQHTRVHSAGHLVADVIESLTPLRGTKGYHFLDSPYVEFTGNYDWDDKQQFLELVNNKLLEAISENKKTQFGVDPSQIKDGKPMRTVGMGDYPSVACAGTHVAELSQIGHVQVTKLKKKRGNLRVSYVISD